MGSFCLARAARNSLTPFPGREDDVRADAIYARLVRAQVDPEEAGLAPEAARHAAGNGLRQIVANTLQGAGDQIVNAKTVLPWLLTGLGAPGAVLALLVPIRESGSMIPQAPMSPVVQRRRQRRWLWVTGAAGQALAVAVMAALAATATGVVAGLGILAALAVFAVSRSLNSLAGKDVLGRTVPTGQRGQINGITTALAGGLAIVVGLLLRGFGGGDAATGVLVALLAAAALAWVLAGAVYAGVREPVAEPEPGHAAEVGWVTRSWQVLREDRAFRTFVAVRTLLLVSALSPPFVVSLAASRADAGLGGLGLFVVAQGVAALFAGRLLGRLADRSSRRVMIFGSGVSSLVIIAFLTLLLVPGVRESWWVYPLTYLLLAVAHTGVRVARKTYVVDLAEGDQRTEYVAVSNTLIGFLLLATGLVSGGIAVLGSEAALVFLAALGVVGMVVGRALPEVERG